MIKEINFLLGNAFALLTICRQHLIEVDDVPGVKLIEDQYQTLERQINDLYYSKIMEKKDVR